MGKYCMENVPGWALEIRGNLVSKFTINGEGSLKNLG